MIYLVLFTLWGAPVSSYERDVSAIKQFQSVPADLVVISKGSSRLYLPKNTCIIDRSLMLNGDNFISAANNCSKAIQHDLLKTAPYPN